MKPKLKFNQSPPLSLYVHLPWCVRKCPYCDFNSHEQLDAGIDESGYIDALVNDITASYPLVQSRDIVSMFIGGGTPSLFSAKSIDRLLSVIDEKIGLTENMEITLEANPGAADVGRFADYRSIGVTRLSIGIQSFNPVHLQAIGRIHDDAQARDAVEFARLAGFDQINLDLMYGLPGQTRQQAMQDLETAINQGASHLSWYQLT
ncbi:MAG: radical SAM family heme chaperone HemW, partial [Gammaproteobacteria bacterium]|nr:radical SAM family heme chaperone HemW [Gammaproteobacteria bacterium]